MTVLLDANALMIPAMFRIDLFDAIQGLVGRFEPVILDAVLHELEGIARSRGEAGSAARIGIRLAGTCRVVEAPEEPGPVDEKLIAYAEKNGCVVVTNDRRLKDELRRRNIPVIIMKNRKILAIVQ